MAARIWWTCPRLGVGSSNARLPRWESRTSSAVSCGATYCTNSSAMMLRSSSARSHEFSGSAPGSAVPARRLTSGTTSTEEVVTRSGRRPRRASVASASSSEHGSRSQGGQSSSCANRGGAGVVGVSGSAACSMARTSTRSASAASRLVSVGVKPKFAPRSNVRNRLPAVATNSVEPVRHRIRRSTPGHLDLRRPTAARPRGWPAVPHRCRSLPGGRRSGRCAGAAPFRRSARRVAHWERADRSSAYSSTPSRTVVLSASPRL